MKWHRDGLYAIKAGKYFITKNSTADGWVYLCHSRDIDGPIGRATDPETAKRICEGKRDELQAVRRK